MSVLIKGLKMPSVCDECWALDESGDYPMCRMTGETRGYNFRVREKRMERCPLIELPDHGDLIDRDELIEEAKILGTVTCHQPFDFPYGCNLVEWCKLAKTVIPAERSEE